MRSSLLLMVPVAALFVACEPPNKVRVPDVTQPATLRLAAPDNPDLQVAQLSIVLSGNVDGRAHIWAPGIKTQSFSGSFYIKARAPWTHTNAVLHYVPDHVTSGGVLVRYAFEKE